MNLIKSRVRTTSRTLDLYPCHCFLVTTIRNWVLDSLDTPRVSHVCTWFLWLSKDSGVQELRPDHPANWTMKNYEILDRPAESTPRLRPWNVVSTRCPAWINDDSCMLYIYIYYIMDYTSCCVPYIGWTGSSVFFSAIHWEFSSHSIYSLQTAILVPTTSTTGQTWRVHSDHQLEPPSPGTKMCGEPPVPPTTDGSLLAKRWLKGARTWSLLFS